jgi:phospholipid transport system substrate-binding protein
MSKTMKLWAIGGVAFLMAFVTPGLAMAPADAADRDLAAEAWVQDLATQATDLLGNSDTTTSDVASEFQTLLVEHTALRSFGRSALGAYSRIISDEDFNRYIALLEQYGTSVVRSRFSEYSGQTVVVTGSSVDTRDNFDYVNVDSDVLDVNGDLQASVRWLLIRRNGEYRVYDITVETTDETATFSLLQTQREEFNSILSSNGGDFNALFDYLRQRIREAGMTPSN